MKFEFSRQFDVRNMEPADPFFKFWMVFSRERVDEIRRFFAESFHMVSSIYG